MFDAFVATTIAAALGFIVAAILGIGLGIVIARWFLMEELLYPYLNIIRVTPIIAIAPLLTIWFGHGRAPVVIVAVIIAFFPIVVGTVLGLKSVDPDLINLMRTLSASDRAILRKIRLPHAMPSIFAAFRISAPLAVIGTLVAEFVGGSSGLGYLLIRARGRIDTSMVFLMVVLSALLGIAFFQVVVAIERRVDPLAPLGHPGLSELTHPWDRPTASSGRHHPVSVTSPARSLLRAPRWRRGPARP